MSVNIKAISFPNNRTALVRFSTLEQTSTRNTERAWQALVRFRYTSSPVTNELRFENPWAFRCRNTGATRKRYGPQHGRRSGNR